MKALTMDMGIGACRRRNSEQPGRAGIVYRQAHDLGIRTQPPSAATTTQTIYEPDGRE
ncbi:MAG: hypothetical protein ACR2G6_07275 [Gemmatimonadaceae bacterium]